MFKSTIGVLTIGLIAMLSMSNMGGRAKQGGEGNTGAPGDKSYNCSECHSGGAYNVSTAITLKDEEEMWWISTNHLRCTNLVLVLLPLADPIQKDMASN
ncbi:MAG: hypothetical protein IPF67_01295 [Saprospiraceae bacterium]|nr:hypothetical protein [Candidatus Brachybacter algidus]